MSVAYADDKQVFLQNAALAWDARADHQRLHDRSVQAKRRRTLERLTELEIDHVQLLRSFREGYPPREVAKC